MMKNKLKVHYTTINSASKTKTLLQYITFDFFFFFTYSWALPGKELHIINSNDSFLALWPRDCLPLHLEAHEAWWYRYVCLQPRQLVASCNRTKYVNPGHLHHRKYQPHTIYFMLLTFFLPSWWWKYVKSMSDVHSEGVFIGDAIVYVPEGETLCLVFLKGELGC